MGDLSVSNFMCYEQCKNLTLGAISESKAWLVRKLLHVYLTLYDGKQHNTKKHEWYCIFKEVIKFKNCTFVTNILTEIHILG